MSGPMRVVAHVDMDAFYCQVEVCCASRAAACAHTLKPRGGAHVELPRGRVQARRDPSLRGVPTAVVQYNPHEQGGVTNVPPDAPRRCNAGNGSIIALSYEARAAGVKRGMRGEEARRACPAIQLVQVPTSHQKADLSIYRDEGKAVIDVLLRRVAMVERASIDEAYLDLTREAAALLAAQGLAACVDAARGTHVGGVEAMPEAMLSQGALRRGHAGAGADAAATPPEQLSAAWLARPREDWSRDEMQLVAGAALAAQLRADVRAALGHSCSAGVAPNKLLAKLATGLRKPDAQTLLPPAATAALVSQLPLARLRGLGGALGAQVTAELQCTTAGELAQVPLARLQARFGEERGAFLHALARGASDEPVKARDVPVSLATSKTFRGQLALRGLEAVHRWLRELAAELEERLAEDRALNARTPRLLTVSVGPAGAAHFSASCPLRAGAATMADDAAALVRRWATAQPTALVVTGMGLRAGNFTPDAVGMRSITDFMAPQPAGGAAARDAAPDVAAAPPAPQAESPAGLRRFFQPAPQAASAAGGDEASCAADGMVRCPKCGRSVAAGRDAEEHADFHFAQELSRQEQRAAGPPPPKKAKTGPLDAMLQRAPRKPK
jgi:DNA polymerase eta